MVACYSITALDSEILLECDGSTPSVGKAMIMAVHASMVRYHMDPKIFCWHYLTPITPSKRCNPQSKTVLKKDLIVHKGLDIPSNVKLRSVNQ